MDSGQERNTLQQRFKELEIAYSTSVKKKDELTQELMQAEDKIGQLERQLAASAKSQTKPAGVYEITKRYQALEKKNADLVARNIDHEKTESELSRQLKEVQDISIQKDTFMEKLRLQNENMNRQLNAVQIERDKFEEKLQVEKKVIYELETERNSWRRIFLGTYNKLNNIAVGNKMPEIGQTSVIKREDVEQIESRLYKHIITIQNSIDNEAGKGRLQKEDFTRLQKELKEKEEELRKNSEYKNSLRQRIQSLELELRQYKGELSQALEQRDLAILRRNSLTETLRKSEEQLQSTRKALSETTSAAKLHNTAQLQDRVTQLASESTRLKEKNKMEEAACAGMKEELAQLQLKLKEEEEKANRCKDDLEQREKVLGEMKESYEEAKETNLAQKKVIQDLKQTQQVNKKMILSLKDTVKKLQERIVMLQNENTICKEKEVHLQKEIAFMKEKMNGLHQQEEQSKAKEKIEEDQRKDFQEIEALINKVTLMEKEIQSLKEKLLASEQSVQRLQAEKDSVQLKEYDRSKRQQDLSQENENLIKSIQKLQEDQKKQMDNYRDLEKKNVRAQEELGLTNSELNQARTTNSKCEERIARMKEDIDSLTQLARDRQQKLESVELKYTDLTKQLAVLKTELDKERSQKKASLKDVEYIQQKASKSDSAKEQLNKALYNKDQEIAELRDMEEKLLKNNTELEESLAEARMEIRHLEGKLEELEGKDAELKTLLNAKEAILTEIDIEKSSLLEQSEKFSQKIKTLSLDLTDKEDRLSRAEEESRSTKRLLEQSEKSREQIEHALFSVKNEKEAAVQKLRSLTATHVNKDAVFEKDRLLNEQISYSTDLAEQVKRYKQQAEELGSELKKRTDEFEAQRKEREDILFRHQKDATELQRDLQSWKEEASSLREFKDKLEEERNALLKDIVDKKREIEDIKSQYEALNQMLNESQKKSTELLSNVSHLQEVHAIEKQAREELEDEILKYKRKVSVIQKFEEKGKESRLMLQKELSQSLEKFESTASKLSYLQGEYNKAMNTISELEVDKNVKEELEKELTELRGKQMKISTEVTTLQDERDNLTKAMNKKDKRLFEIEKILKHTQENEARLKEFLKQTEENFISKDVYEKLKKELSEKLEQNDSFIAEIEVLKENIKEKNNSIGELSNQKDKLENAIHEANVELETLKSQALFSKQSVEKCSRKLQDCQKQLNVTSSSHRKLEDEAKELRNQNANLKAEAENLKLSQRELEQEIDYLNERCLEMKAAIEARETEFGKLQTKSHEDEKRITNLENLKDRLDRKINSLKNENRNFEELIKTLNAKNSELTRKSEEYTALMEGLQAKLDDAKLHTESLEDKVVTAGKELEEKERKIGDLLQENESLKTQKLTRAKSMEELKRMVVQGNSQIKAMETTASEWSAKEEKTAQTLHKYSIELHATKTELEAIVSRSKQLQNDLENEKRERERENKEFENWKKDYNDLWKRYQETLTNYESSKDELEEAKARMQKLVEEKEKIKKEKEMLRGEINVIENKVVATNLALEKGKKQKEQLMNDLTQARKKITEMEVSFEDSKQSLIKKVVEAESQLATSTDKFGQIRVQFSEQQKQNLERSKSLDSIRIKYDKLQREKAQLQKDLNEMLENEKSKDALIKSLQEKNERQSVEIETGAVLMEEQESKIEILNGKLKQLNVVLESTKENLIDAESKYQTLFQENKDIKHTLQLSGKRAAEWQESINELQSKIVLYEEKLSKAEKCIMGLETDRSIYKQERDEALNNLEAYRGQAQDLRKAQVDSIGDLEQIKKECSLLHRTLTSTEEKSKLDQVKIRELEKSLNDCDATKMLLKKKLAEVEEEARNVTDQLARYENVMKKTEEEKNRLLREYTMVSAMAEEFKATEASLRKEKDRLGHQISVRDKDISSLQNEVEVLQDKLSEAELTVSRNERHKKLTDADNEKLQQDLDLAVKKTESVREQFMSELASQHAEILKLRAENDYLVSELSQRESEIRRHNYEVDLEREKLQLSNQYAIETEELKAKVDELKKSEISTKSELKLAKNKLNAYVKEREKWENKVKTVVAEIEREKSKNEYRERDLLALQARLEKENDYSQKRISSLEQELVSVKETSQQQLESAKTAHELELETRRLEVESLRRQINLQSAENKGNRFEWEELRMQLQKRNKELEEVKHQLQSFKDRHQLETSVLKNDIQTSRMEYQLSVHKSAVSGSGQSKEHGEKIKELADMLQKTKKESDRIRAELKTKYGIKI